MSSVAATTTLMVVSTSPPPHVLPVIASAAASTSAPPTACVDIKEFLWHKSNDLTALPVTMCVFAVVYSAIITLGVVGNCLVIVSVYRHRSLQSVRNIFIVSLSCSDVVVSIVSGTITPITAFTKVWLFGAALCKLVPVIQGTSLCFSTLTLTAISIDRFILIIYPTRRSIQKRHAFRMILLNWLIASAISMPMFFKQVLIDFNNFCGRFCAEDWGSDQTGRSTYGTLVFVLQFVIPFLVITFCYLMISLKLSKGMMLRKEAERTAVCSRKRKSDESGSSVPMLTLEHKTSFINNSSSPSNKPKRKINGTCSNNNNNKHGDDTGSSGGASNGAPAGTATAVASSDQRRAALKRRLRTNRMLMAMVGVFLCCWTPSVVFNFLRDYQWLPGVVLQQEYLCGIVTHCISMSSTVWNPVLYALLNEHFRLAFMQLLRRGGRNRKRDLFLETTGIMGGSGSGGGVHAHYSVNATNTFIIRLFSHRVLTSAFANDDIVASSMTTSSLRKQSPTITTQPDKCKVVTVAIAKNTTVCASVSENNSDAKTHAESLRSSSITSSSSSASATAAATAAAAKTIVRCDTPAEGNTHIIASHDANAMPFVEARLFFTVDDVGYCESDEEV